MENTISIVNNEKKNKTGKINQSWYTSGNDIWATPRVFFEQLDSEFGFTLDACAIKDNACCSKFFSPEDDGLKQDWAGHVVYCNPPYSELKLWARKCYEESQKPETKVVMLIPARTDTGYFHDWIYGKAELRFIRGRLHYNDGPNPAPFPSMVVVFH